MAIAINYRDNSGGRPRNPNRKPPIIQFGSKQIIQA